MFATLMDSGNAGPIVNKIKEIVSDETGYLPLSTPLSYDLFKGSARLSQIK